MRKKEISMFKRIIEDIWMDYENEAYLDQYQIVLLSLDLIYLEQLVNYIT